MRPLRRSRAALAGCAFALTLGIAACGDDDGAGVRNIGEAGSGSVSGTGSHGSGSGSHGSGSGSHGSGSGSHP